MNVLGDNKLITSNKCTTTHYACECFLNNFYEMKEDLRKSIQYLKEGKLKFTPSTTNSLVDDLIKKYEKVG